MNLKKNLFWAGSLRVVTRVLTFLKTIILARLLTPSQFGIFGIATLVLGLLEMLTETGVNVVLIQEKDNIKKYLDTGWVVSIIRGALIFSVIILLIPFTTSFFNAESSKDILYIISLIPLVRGFINPAVVKYQKDLAFHKEFYFRIVLTFVEVLSTVILTYLTRSENALAFGFLISAVFEVVISFLIISPRPKISFDIKGLVNVVSKGKWVTAAKIFDYLFTHLDDIVVGRLLGSYSLGIYQQAYRITSLPIIEVAETFQKVTFPTYSRLVSENKKVTGTYLKMLFYTSVLVLPFGVLLYLFPSEIIKFVLGSQWLEAANVLKVLAVFCVIKTMANSIFPVLLAYKRQDLVMILTMFGILGLGVTIYPLVNTFGLVGAGLSTIIGSLVMVPVGLVAYRKVIND